MQKVWLVTGASRGIGAQIARAVLEADDCLIATARRKDSLASLGNSEKLLCLSLDVTDEEQARSVAEAAVQHFGRIDVLVNNAGYGLLGAVEETSNKEAQAVYRTNVFGLLNITRASSPSCASSVRDTSSICRLSADTRPLRAGASMARRSSPSKASRKRSMQS